MTTLRPLAPRGRGWVHHERHWTDGVPSEKYAHRHRRLVVLSQLANMEWRGNVEPTWLVSVSRRGRLATDREVRFVATAFGMAGWEEDNHQPGVARCLFMLVDPELRGECECKVDEVQVQTGGKTWSNDPDPAKCRGCEMERLLRHLGEHRPCPLHNSEAA